VAVELAFSLHTFPKCILVHPKWELLYRSLFDMHAPVDVVIKLGYLFAGWAVRLAVGLGVY
jgi:hypothetical protein